MWDPVLWSVAVLGKGWGKLCKKTFWGSLGATVWVTRRT